jgi:TolB protein
MAPTCMSWLRACQPMARCRRTSHPIWTAPIPGGEPALISTDCSGKPEDCQESDPAYSARGARLAFVHRGVENGAAFTQIGIRDLVDGTATYVDGTRMAAALGYLAQPSWSLDGTAIVYYRAVQKPSDQHVTDTRLYVAKVDGSGAHELPHPDGEWAADPDWSPDGTRIVFSTAPNRETEGWGEFPGHAAVWTVAPDGSGQIQLCTTCLGGGSAPSWTPDGEHIMFWGFRSWALMDPDGANAAHINQPKLTWFAGNLGYGYAGFLAPAEVDRAKS